MSAYVCVRMLCAHIRCICVRVFAWTCAHVCAVHVCTRVCCVHVCAMCTHVPSVHTCAVRAHATCAHVCAVCAHVPCAHLCAVWHRPVLRPWAHSSQLSLPPASCGWESTGFCVCPPSSSSLSVPQSAQGLFSLAPAQVTPRDPHKGPSSLLEASPLFSRREGLGQGERKGAGGCLPGAGGGGTLCSSLAERELEGRVPPSSAGDGTRWGTVGASSLLREVWTLSEHCPVSARHLPGPCVGHGEHGGLPSWLPPQGLLAGSQQRGRAWWLWGGGGVPTP